MSWKNQNLLNRIPCLSPHLTYLKDSAHWAFFPISWSPQTLSSGSYQNYSSYGSERSDPPCSLKLVWGALRSQNPSLSLKRGNQTPPTQLLSLGCMRFQLLDKMLLASNWAPYIWLPAWHLHWKVFMSLQKKLPSQSSLPRTGHLPRPLLCGVLTSLPRPGNSTPSLARCLLCLNQAPVPILFYSPNIFLKSSLPVDLQLNLCSISYVLSYLLELPMQLDAPLSSLPCP